MSILIEGMDMPKAQFQKSSTLYHVEGTIFVYPDGKTRTELSVDYNERKSYPLISVPEPHGRLISADELIEFIENRYEITWKDDYEGGIKDACVDILEKISTMPTAIQASEDEL